MTGNHSVRLDYVFFYNMTFCVFVANVINRLFAMRMVAGAIRDAEIFY